MFVTPMSVDFFIMLENKNNSQIDEKLLPYPT